MNKLEDFLLSNSKINKQFIKDFFGFQKRIELKENEPFIINLEDIAFWLKTRKNDLKETLINSYNKDID